jgi:hypothetical protein
MSRRRSRFLAGLAAAVVAVSGSFVAATATPVSAATSYWIVENWYGVQMQESETSTQVEMMRHSWQHPLPDNAKWDIIAMHGDAEGYYRFETPYGQCMAVLNASKVSGTAVIVANCGTALNDYWGLVKVKSSGGHDYYNLVNRRSKLCLNIKGASSADGAELIQYKCDSSAWNEWFTWRGESTWPTQ